MLVVFFAAGLIVSSSLAYAGLIKGELQFSAGRQLTGTAARNVGIACGVLSLAMLALIAWAMMGAKGIG
jgi:hypothetical protein